MEPLYIVYGLIDPNTKKLRYIGKSTRGLERPRQHFWPSNVKQRRYVYNWIRGLLAVGLKPEIITLEVHSVPDTLYDAEQRLIAFFRALGAPLTNLSDGGPGWSGPKSEAVRLKISKALKGRHIGPPSAEHRRRLRESNLGKKRSEETRLNMAISKGGRPFVDQNEMVYHTIQGAARTLGLRATDICRVLKGRRKSVGGYRFSYQLKKET